MDQERGCDLDVTMVADVEVEHEVDECTNETRSGTDEQRKPAAGDGRATLEIQHTQQLTQLPVRLGRELVPNRCTPVANHGIVRCVTVGKLVTREIRDAQHYVV